MTTLFDKIGDYCRTFRMVTLRKRLIDVAGDTNIKTLSGFEHGRSSNIEYMNNYYQACDTESQQMLFKQGIDDILMGDLFANADYQEYLEEQRLQGIELMDGELNG